jgi:nitronate monooxygenase
MSTTQQSTSGVSSNRRPVWSLCDGITLRVPVVQGVLGSCDGPRLAAAVSRAGALGTLTLHGTEPDAAQRRLARVRRLTLRPILIAFTAQWEKEAVRDNCLAAGHRHFQVFWWNGPRHAPRIHEQGGVVFWQVGSVEQAYDALECGADVLVAQGTEAGGQVRGPHPLAELVPLLREAVGEKVPIVAGGGLADRCDVAKTLAFGANAALLGTRFLLSEEANAAPNNKSRLLRAETNDLTLDLRFIGDWPCAPRRRLVLSRDEDTPALFAGKGLSRIKTLLPAAEIVRSLAPD